MLSARNQLPATVKSVVIDGLTAEVIMDVAGVEVVSTITKGSAERLGLKAGDAVTAVIKASEVLIDKS
jgi:molybdopterin-binding protein